MNTVAPNSPSEIANANPAATSAARATIGRSTSRHTRAGEAPERRRRVTQAGIDGAQHRASSPARRTAPRPAPARSGTSHHEPRKSKGAWSRAMRKPNPTVTAETPRGSDTSASSPRRRDDASANAAQPPTTTAITVATTAKRSELAIACTGSHEQRAARVHLAERSVEVETVARSACRTNARRARRSARRAAAAISARLAPTNARAPAVRGRRAVSAAARSDSDTRWRPSIQLVSEEQQRRWRAAARR